MLIKILVVVAVILVVLAIIIARQPSEFRVTRSAKMSAAASAVFAQINDFHNWQAWSPWAKMDPNAQNVFEGPASGVGAVFKWSGNGKVGAGKMTLTDSHSNDSITIRLEFLKPMVATNIAEFTFKPEGDQTLVTWTMTGHANFMAKAIGLLMNCEKMVGGQFDEGLANIKAIVEK